MDGHAMQATGFEARRRDRSSGRLAGSAAHGGARPRPRHEHRRAFEPAAGERHLADHESLWRAARELADAVARKDSEETERLALALFGTLRTHLGGEALAMVHLPPATARLLQRGQERLLGACAEIVCHAATGQGTERGESVLGVEWLIGLLWLQLRDEEVAGLGEVA